MHQWFWDSCTHAMGLAYYNPQQALQEISSLVAGQWENGHIGHITFNPSEASYFPGPSFWQIDQFTHHTLVSSGLIQPPLLAVALNHIDDVLRKKNMDTSLVDSLLPHAISYHAYLKKQRDPKDCGLLTIIHPWESGTDNAPRWDTMLSKIAIANIPKHITQTVDTYRTDTALHSKNNRPQKEDYYRYLYLIDLYKQKKWKTEDILQETPFATQDILVNSIWCRANHSLARLLEKREKKSQAAIFAKWTTQTTNAIQESWDAELGIFANTDLSTNAQNTTETIATFLPLYAHAATEHQCEMLLKKLADPLRYWTPFPVASVPLNSPFFEIKRYWRGPTWPITNLFLVDGLFHYKDISACKTLFEELLHKTCSMIEDIGFYEHYDPLRGLSPEYAKEKSGMGFAKFSWSAAVYLYIKNAYSAYF